MVRVPRMLFFAQILQEAQTIEYYFCLKISDFLDFVLSRFSVFLKLGVLHSRVVTPFYMSRCFVSYALEAFSQCTHAKSFHFPPAHHLSLYPQSRTITFDNKYVLCWSQWAGTVLQTITKGYVYKQKLMIQRKGAERAMIFRLERPSPTRPWEACWKTLHGKQKNFYAHVMIYSWRCIAT